jgi:hypothetical protein
MNNASNKTGTLAQFQRLVLSFLLMPLVASTFSGCLDDFDFRINPVSVDLTEQFLWPGETGPRPRLTIGIDSASQMNDSTIRLFVNLNYDSVIITTAYGVSYAKTGDTLALIKIFSAKADTLDFRRLPEMKYSYALDMDLVALESKVTYVFCPVIDYIVKGDTIRLSGTNPWTRCYYLEN